MSNPVSMTQMIAMVRNRANLENFTGSVTDPNIIDFLNEGIGEMFDEQIAQRNMEYFRNSVSFTTNPNQSGYPLPTDFYEMISLDVVVSPYQTLTARPYMESERSRFKWYSGWVSWLPVWFRLLGTASQSGASLTPGTINFTPTPAMVTIFTINYIPCFQPFALDGSQNGNVIDGVNGWQGMAVWGAVAMALEKMEQDSSFALSKKEQFRERIQAMAGDRHAGDPERIHDVFANDADMFGFGNGF